MSLTKEIQELLKAGVITEETANRIQDYYRQKKSGNSQNRLVIAFSILGAILVGLGIILILAHNWDEFSRPVKTFLAFLPLLIGQAVCIFTLVRKGKSTAWMEGSSVFLFFAVGACISLVSQIYHIPGDISSFILTWMLLSLPLVYIMKSSVTSMLYLVGITYFGLEVGFFDGRETDMRFHLYWPMLLLIFPYYYQLFKKKPDSNFITFHHWLFPLSLTMVLGGTANEVDELLFVAYVSMFGFFYILGGNPYFKDRKTRNNGYLIVGSLGTVITLIILSFREIWSEVKFGDKSMEQFFSSPEFAVTLLITTLAAIVLWKEKLARSIKPDAFDLVFLIFILFFILGQGAFPVFILISLLILYLGIITIRRGARQGHLGVLNYGLLIIAALILK
jgi:uncharacterized membrane protein